MLTNTNGSMPGVDAPKKANPPSLSTVAGGFENHQPHRDCTKTAYFLGTIKEALIRFASWLAVVLRVVA